MLYIRLGCKELPVIGLARFGIGKRICQRQATLGRYMLEMRHGLNNALTSVLGNSELLLLEPGAFSAPVREQIEIIRNMGLRMHEIIQRFSSLESEMRVAEERGARPVVPAKSFAAARG